MTTINGDEGMRDPFHSNIRWATRPPSANGTFEGTLCGVGFTLRVYSNGNPSAAGWKARVRLDGEEHESVAFGHVGGISAAIKAGRQRVRDLVYEWFVDRGYRCEIR